MGTTYSQCEIMRPLSPFPNSPFLQVLVYSHSLPKNFLNELNHPLKRRSDGSYAGIDLDKDVTGVTLVVLPRAVPGFPIWTT